MGQNKPGCIEMSMRILSRTYRDSRIKVKDRDRVLKLVKIYADQEKIRDEAKAITLLIYNGYTSWVSSKATTEIEEMLAKYYTIANDLIEVTRELLLITKETYDKVDDEKIKEKLYKYMIYAGRILDTIIVEMSE